MKKIALISVIFFVVVIFSGCTKDKVVSPEVNQETSIETTQVEDSILEDKNLDKKLADNNEAGAKELKNDTASEKKTEPKIISQQTLLILDASGSMWGQIEGKTKIAIAKEVIKKTVKNFESTELGLMAYGHRKKGDCKDIEILTAPKEDNAQNISQMVDKISPKGMTPMGASVLMAAESLKYTEQKATVILVSDGIETCDVDLCELGKKLEKTGVDFTAHVIGFDMTEEQTAGLKCLASETGGTFTSAKSADDLDKALKETVEASSCSKEKLGEATITAPKTIGAGSAFEIQYTGPKNSADFIAIVPKGSTNSNDHISYLYPEDNDTNLTAPVEAGEYDIVYFASCGAELGRTMIAVVEVSATITAPETVNAGSGFSIQYTGPKNSGDFIAIVPKGSTNSNDHISYLYPEDNDTNLTAPVESGEYDIVYWADRDKVLAKREIKILAVSATITSPGTVSVGSAFDIQYTGPKNSGDFIAIVPKGSTNSNDHISYLYPEDNDTNLTAPADPGEYDIVYWLGSGKKEIGRTSLRVTN